MRNIFYKADPRWWSCERKKRYTDKPETPKGMRAYSCTFCNGWHLTTDKRPAEGEMRDPA